MNTILLSTATFSIAGGVSGFFYEAAALHRVHAQGFALARTDFTFKAIYATTFGVIGILVGLMLYRLTRRSKEPSVSH